jgi:hypothetical protein
LARSGPGGPAQPLQASRLHRHASCLTCATSPHPPPSRAPAPPHRRTRTEIVITQAGILGLRSRLARSGPGGPAQPLQASRLHRHASCLTCATSPHRPSSILPEVAQAYRRGQQGARVGVLRFVLLGTAHACPFCCCGPIVSSIALHSPRT